MFPFWVILDGFLAPSSLEAKRSHLNSTNRDLRRRCSATVSLLRLYLFECPSGGGFPEVCVCVCVESVCVSVNLTFNNRRRRQSFASAPAAGAGFILSDY